MDWTQIITSIATIAGTVIAVIYGNGKTKDMLTYRMDSVEKKLDKHNHFGERLKGVETGLKHVCQRVDKIENKQERIGA